MPTGSYQTGSLSVGIREPERAHSVFHISDVLIASVTVILGVLGVLGLAAGVAAGSN